MFNNEKLSEIHNENIVAILNIMRQKMPCDYACLAQNTGLGLTTVKKCVEECVEDGMVIFGDMADSTGGRKAQQFNINPDYQNFILIIPDNNQLIVNLYDFSKKLIKQEKKNISVIHFYDEIRKIIEDYKSRFPTGTVGISLPCVVKNGEIIDWYYNKGMQGINVIRELEKEFSVNVVAQNDMKLSVLGATLVPERQGINNIVSAQFGHNGIGVGEIVNGHLLDGFSGFAGEVGYIKDLRKDIMGTAYLAKIIRSVIICINPEMIVFYRSERQNSFEKIFREAVKELPEYAVPRYEISDGYKEDIESGLFYLIEKNGYIKIRT